MGAAQVFPVGRRRQRRLQRYSNSRPWREKRTKAIPAILKLATLELQVFPVHGGRRKQRRHRTSDTQTRDPRVTSRRRCHCATPDAHVQATKNSHERLESRHSYDSKVCMFRGALIPKLNSGNSIVLTLKLRIFSHTVRTCEMLMLVTSRAKYTPIRKAFLFLVPVNS